MHMTGVPRKLSVKDTLNYMRICTDTAAACTLCAEMATEEGIDCWKHCRATALLCETTMKWISMNMPEIDTLLQMTTKVAHECARMCEKHADREHCVSCASACDKLVNSLKGFRTAA
eukprot:TRINITY_DN4657_c0_g2_i1.p2 TRINITY_DN4657_c0_g2~~TRINITY_DN4657_c0_g2_i1.p2  ORF type:complete len:117 (+),score=44.87 TRINITY_DN4657_c0_g2_i1:436-786(+)